MAVQALQRVTGTIRAFHGSYGFITDDHTADRDIYFHASRVRLGDNPEVGCRVSYCIQQDKRGLRAVAVEVL